MKIPPHHQHGHVDGFHGGVYASRRGGGGAGIRGQGGGGDGRGGIVRGFVTRDAGRSPPLDAQLFRGGYVAHLGVGFDGGAGKYTGEEG